MTEEEDTNITVHVESPCGTIKICIFGLGGPGRPFLHLRTQSLHTEWLRQKAMKNVHEELEESVQAMEEELSKCIEALEKLDAEKALETAVFPRWESVTYKNVKKGRQKPHRPPVRRLPKHQKFPKKCNNNHR